MYCRCLLTDYSYVMRPFYVISIKGVIVQISLKVECTVNLPILRLKLTNARVDISLTEKWSSDIHGFAVG